MIRTASDILIASNFALIAITNFNASFMRWGYELLEVQRFYSLDLSHFFRWAARLWDNSSHESPWPLTEQTSGYGQEEGPEPLRSRLVSYSDSASVEG